MAKYQYIGSGEDSPKSIKFMGQVRFRLNEGYVEVTDAEILAKLEGNKCFKIKTEPKKAPKKVRVTKTKEAGE